LYSAFNSSAFGAVVRIGYTLPIRVISSFAFNSKHTAYSIWDMELVRIATL
jgi:hypothetical protein